MHKLDDVIKNEGGGCRRQLWGDPATPIDYIHYKLMDSMLLLLYIIYNLGLLH